MRSLAGEAVWWVSSRPWAVVLAASLAAAAAVAVASAGPGRVDATPPPEVVVVSSKLRSDPAAVLELVASDGRWIRRFEGVKGDSLEGVLGFLPGDGTCWVLKVAFSGDWLAGSDSPPRVEGPSRAPDAACSALVGE